MLKEKFYQSFQLGARLREQVDTDDSLDLAYSKQILLSILASLPPLCNPVCEEADYLAPIVAIHRLIRDNGQLQLECAQFELMVRCIADQ